MREGYGDIAFIYRLEGDDQEMLTTLGFGHAGSAPYTDVELLAAAVDLEAEWFENVCPAANMYTGWTYKGARGTFRPTDGDDIPFEIARNVAGTASGETPPVNVSLLIKKITGFGGRANRGRMFVPPFGISEANIPKNGVMATATVSGQQAFYTAFLTEVLSNGIALPVLHHTNEVLAPTTITSLILQDRVATQRRRLRP